MSPPASIFQAPHLQSKQLHFRNFGQHLHQFFLSQLEGCDGLSKLNPLFGITQGPVVAIHGRSNGAPGNAVASFVQAHQSALEPVCFRESIGLGDSYIFKIEPRGN